MINKLNTIKKSNTLNLLFKNPYRRNKFDRKKFCMICYEVKNDWKLQMTAECGKFKYFHRVSNSMKVSAIVTGVLRSFGLNDFLKLFINRICLSNRNLRIKESSVASWEIYWFCDVCENQSVSFWSFQRKVSGGQFRLYRDCCIFFGT